MQIKINIKRQVSIFLIFLLAIFYFCQPVLATESEEGGLVVLLQDQEVNSQIEGLLAVRRELELNYSDNEDLIQQVDQQLLVLGLETVSSAEIQSKLGAVAPAIDIPSTSTVCWTSRRVVVSYHGQLFEMQIYEGIPCATNSPLLNHSAAAVYEAQGITAGITNALKIIGLQALGTGSALLSDCTSLVSGVSVLDAFLTATDVLEEFQDSLSTSTVFSEVSGTVNASLTTHMRYIFVKQYETPDTGNQVLCYIGNSVSYVITTVSMAWVPGDIEPVAEHITNRISGSSYAAYYDDFSEAARNYYNYHYYEMVGFNDDYYLTKLHFNFFETNVTFNVPLSLLSVV